MPENSIASNRSALKDFLGSIATMTGDLSNVTAPPFVLAENSTVEIPQYWCDHAQLWVAPAGEEDAEKRALLVLEGFLGSLKKQQYAGRDESAGLKKPLNAFLGELFVGSWADEELGETRLIAEQVSHHPPVTACYLWNDKHGIRAEGFTEQEITFSGNVSIKQKGYAITHIDKYDEDYLIPMPDIKVKGVLTGLPYPELHGEYALVGSNGYTSRITFGGKGLLGSGQKNSFDAELFHADRPDAILYVVKGAWNRSWTVTDCRTSHELARFDADAIPSTPPLRVADLDAQDPWESRCAWRDVIAALRRGDMKGAADAKSVVENGQRAMRKEEEAEGRSWRACFFQNHAEDRVFDRLAAASSKSFVLDRQQGFWKVDRRAAEMASPPYHPGLLPTNERVQGQEQTPQQHQIAHSQVADLTDPAHHANGPTSTQSSSTATTASPEFPHDRPAGAAGQAQTRSQTQTQPPSTSTNSTNDPVTTPGAPPLSSNANIDGPTDAQVESFLRARYSSATATT